jgi:hypothetical protein
MYMTELIMMRFSALIPEKAEPNQATVEAKQQQQPHMQEAQQNPKEALFEILVHVENAAVVLPASSQYAPF